MRNCYRVVHFPPHVNVSVMLSV